MESRPWHRFYEPAVPASLPFQDLTLPQWLERAVERHGDRTALIFRNGKLSYRRLKDQVDRLATALAAMGVARGDRVAIQLPNIPQFVIAYYAIQSLGAVAAPTNPTYTPREIEHQWNDAGCVVAILLDVLYEGKVKAMRDRLPVRDYIVASIPEYLGFPLNLLAPLQLRRQKPPLVATVTPGPGVHLFRKLIDATPPRPPQVTLRMDDLSTLVYTGGTTGVSKGAALTHANLSSNLQQMRAWFARAEDGREVVISALPYYHSFGLTVCMNLAVGLGAQNVLIANPRITRDILKSIARHRVTLFAAAPVMFQSICDHPDVTRFDLSSVRFCNSGSAPLSVDVLKRFEHMTGGKIAEGYGLTETSPVTHCNPLYGTRKLGSIGVPLPSTDARVVDPESGTKDVPPNEVGELIIQGPQVMQGYWQKPAETAQMIRDGWLYTGDLCRVDEEGYCFVVGRKKDMILCSGFNVYPDEIDRVLMSHPAILEAATIGVPDAKRGETVKSFVVVRPGSTLTVDQVLAFARENLAPYKVPRMIEFRDSLPRSPLLKVLRRELKAQELTKQGQASG